MSDVFQRMSSNSYGSFSFVSIQRYDYMNDNINYKSDNSILYYSQTKVELWGHIGLIYSYDAGCYIHVDWY